MNYGETLAHWYLRLNGFFPLRDFVLHRGEGLDRTSDCDLLAIRFPHVFEEVGGQADDWDRRRFDEWGLDLSRPIVVIAQVKTGREQTCRGAFTEAKLRRALRRVGLWEAGDVKTCAQKLHKVALVSDPKAQIMKLLVAEEPQQQLDSYRTLPLRDALAFVRQRFDAYRETKRADRLFFHDELIQFLASNEGKP